MTTKLKLRIDYLNIDKEPRHTFVNIINNWDNFDTLGFEITSIILQWWTDVRVYKLT